MSTKKSMLILITLMALCFPGMCWSQSGGTGKPVKTTGKPQAVSIPKQDENWLKKGISIGASLSTGSRTLMSFGGSIRCPLYKVKFWVANNTDRLLQLGESLIIVEKSKSSESVVSLYATCEGDGPCPHLHRFEERYGLTFGVGRNRHSTSGTVIGTKENFAIEFLWATHYKGFGYGPVEPGSRREIESDIYAPYGIKEGKEYVVLVLPYITIKDNKNSPRIQTVLYFDPATLENEQQNPQRQVTYGVCSSELSPMIADANSANWFKVFALNWLAETKPVDAAKMLPSLIIPVQQTNALLVQAAVLDSGMIKQTSSVPALTKLLESEVFSKTEIEPLVEFPKFILMALGDVGDASAAPIIRPYLNHQNLAVRNAAIEALGNLKDEECLEKLLTLLKDKEQSRWRRVIFEALAQIGKKAALDPLLALMQDASYEDRNDVAEALSKARSADVLPILIQVASDGNEKENMRKSCISTLGRLDDPQAAAVLCSFAEGEVAALHEVALEALGSLPDTESLACLQRLAAKAGYDKQREAQEIIETRSYRKKT